MADATPIGATQTTAEAKQRKNDKIAQALADRRAIAKSARAAGSDDRDRAQAPARPRASDRKPGQPPRTSE
eukprot:3438268-Heterocapsa_arctica.AAC.1